MRILPLLLSRVRFGSCWDWRGMLSRKGYGVFRGKYAHRLMYEAVHGDGSLAGKILRHTCDNRRCCRPTHLIPGTPQENVRDRDQRGRTAREHALPWTKLSWPTVLGIRRARKEGLSVSLLADQYGVSRSTIYKICSGSRRALAPGQAVQ